MILCETQDQWEHEITSAISNALQAAIRLRGKASLLVSGGSTPKPIYERLSREDLDWKNVHIALVDERWVEPDHPCLLYTSPSPRDKRQSRMPSSA